MTMPLKRFVLFAAADYSWDGWDDYQSSFETLALATAYASKDGGKAWRWYHIVDMQNDPPRIVCKEGRLAP